MQKSTRCGEASNMHGTEKYINFGRNDRKEIHNFEDTYKDGKMKILRGYGIKMEQDYVDWTHLAQNIG
jgi:hypothetical protein